MSAAPARRIAPTRITRSGQHSIEVLWQDGHVSQFPNRYLRDNCPCAACRDRHPRRTLPVVGGPGDLYPLAITLVGRYAVNIRWSDQHDGGIYSYETLRGLCPCDRCQAATGATPAP